MSGEAPFPSAGYAWVHSSTSANHSGSEAFFFVFLPHQRGDMGGGWRTQIFPLFIPSVGANTEPPSQEESQRQIEKHKLLSHREEEREGENMGEENTPLMFSVAPN